MQRASAADGDSLVRNPLSFLPWITAGLATGALWGAALPADAAVAGVVARAPAAVSDDAVARKLKEALAESQARLGELEPWQRKIFEEEAIPQYQRFVRDYRSSQRHSGTAISTLSVDIDLDSLKKYLAFHASTALGAPDPAPDEDAEGATGAQEAKGQPSMLVYLRQTGKECGPRCSSAFPVLRKLSLARVVRRGFKPVWITDEDLGAQAPALDDKGVDERVAGLISARGAAGAFVLEWGKVPVDDLDSAHADENHYLVRTTLEVRGIGGGQGASFRNEGKLELLENDPFEASFARLATDAFTELGARALAQASQRGSGRVDGARDAEVGVAVTGFDGFSELMRAKAALQARFPGASVQERKVARGRAVLAVVGERSRDAVRKALGELNPAGAGGAIRMEVEP